MKILVRVLAVLLFIIIAVLVFVFVAGDKTFDAPYPEIQASTDSAVIARGKYLAFGPAHCGTCHVPMDKIMAVEDGQQMPLSGGWELDIPPGVFRAPNLTPDPETGIGKFTDAEIARVLRYSVAPDGRFIAPFMPFQELSDEDLTAIISFLRSQEPVRHEVKKSEIKFLGRALTAFGVLEPRGPQRTPPKSVKRDSTAAYGEYLANSVGNCFGCHTELDMKTGKNIGPPFAGGSKFGPDHFSKGMVYVSPNLTPDKETGIMADWDEELFIDRFRGGRIYEGSPMPWGAFSRMEETDLKALFHYLKSLKPVPRRIAEIVYDPETQ